MAAVTWAQWFAELDRLGVEEKIFDPAGTTFLCPGARPRRPYGGEDGFFRICFESGLSPQQALGEALVEQDAG